MSQSEPPLSGSSCSFRVAAARAVLAAFAVVLALSAAWALRAPAEAQSIRDGSFIRQSGTDDIYRVKIVGSKRFKWLVVNEAAFCSYRSLCPWSSVIDVSRSVLNRYTTSTLARRGSNTAVWRFAPSGDSGTRRWLNITAREFEAAGFDWDAVHSITTTDFNQYRRGSDLTCADFGVCNEPPRITGTRNLSFDAGERVSSQRVATISDRDTRLSALRVRVSGLPSGWRHSFSTSSGRLTVSGTAPSRAGSHRVTITVSDGQGSDTERFTITVNETHDPEITLVDDGFEVQAGQRVTSRRVATIRDRDTRLRDLTVRVSGLPSGWRHSFSTSSGRLTVSGTAPSRAGSHTVTITASDGRGSDRERFTITVAAPDCAETIQSGSFIRRSGTEDVYRVKIVGGKRFKWLILNEAAFNSYGVAWSQICDTSQSVLDRYTTSNLARRGTDPEVWRFASSGDSGTRRWLHITPSEFERAGYDWDAVFSLRPGDFNAYTVATLPTTCDDVDGRNVCDEPAQPPVISIVSSSVSVDAGQRVSPRHVATVADADTPLRDLAVSVSGLPAGVTHSFSTSDGRLTVSGTAPSSAGSHQITIRATDGQGSDVERFTITVTAAPTDCAEAIQDRSFIRQNGTDDVYRVRIADGKRFKWLILNEAAFNSYGVAWSQICDTSQSVLGRYTTSDLARRGSDEEVWRFASSGDSGTRRWLNMSASEFEAAGFDWAAVHSLSAGDFGEYTEGEELTCADFDVCSEPGDPIEDPIEEESTATGQANEPPEIANLTAPLTVTEGQNVDATQVATVTDSEDALRLNEQVRINGLPPGLDAHDLSSTGRLTISGTIEAGTARTYTATITANDGTNLGVAEDFQITVLEGEDLPTFDPAVFVVEEPLILGRSETVQLAGASGGSPPLMYTLRDAPAGMVFDAGALTLSGTPTGAVGEHTMYLRATDSRDLSAEQRITYTILPCLNDRTDAKEQLGAGDTQTWQGEWTLLDCTTERSQYVTDHIGHYRDIYSFVTSEAVEVTIDLESDDVGTYIHLLDNDGQRVGLSSTGTGSDGNDARVTAQLRAGQKYWVRATTERRGATGAYSLTVTAKAAIQQDGCAHTEIEVRVHGAGGGETLGAGGRETLYERHHGEWTEDDCTVNLLGQRSEKYHDRFLLKLPRAATVIILLSTGDSRPSTTGDSGACYSIHTPPWSLEDRVADCDASPSTSRRTGFEELAGGEHLLDVTSHLADVKGPYTLWILAYERYDIRGDFGTLKPFASQAVSSLWLGCADGCRSQYVFRLAEPASINLHSVRSRLSGGTATLLRERVDGELEVVEEIDVVATPPISRYVSDLDAGHYVVRLEGNVETLLLNFLSVELSIWPTVSDSVALTAQYAPILRFDEGEEMHPVAAEVMIENSALRRAGVTHAYSTKPTVETLFKRNTPEDYLDFYYDRVSIGHGRGSGDEWKDALKDSSKFVLFKTPKPTAYVHLTEYNPGAATSILSDDEDWKGIQYWFFYVYNNADGPVWDHEGDWEAVTLWWKDAEWEDILGDDGVRPTEVGFSAHEHGYYVVPSESSCLGQSWRRPTAYVAANNHPSFPVSGTYGNVPPKKVTQWINLVKLVPIPAGPIPIPGGLILTEVVNVDDALGRAYRKRVEDLSASDQESIARLRENGTDEARAGGTGKTLTHSDYDVRVLPAQPWFEWQGRWGAPDKGPVGPGQKMPHRRHWRMPPSEIPVEGNDERDWWKRSGCHSTRADQSWMPPLHGVDDPLTYG